MRGLREALAPGDRVMVVNRMSSLMGEAGEVVRRKGESDTYHILLDEDEDAIAFHRDELERLP